MILEIIMLIGIIYLGGIYLWSVKIMSEYARELLLRIDSILAINWDWRDNIFEDYSKEELPPRHYFLKERDSFMTTKFWEYLIETDDKYSPIVTRASLAKLNNAFKENTSFFPNRVFKAYKTLLKQEKKIKCWERKLMELRGLNSILNT